jgi:hypothetical protein
LNSSPPVRAHVQRGIFLAVAALFLLGAGPLWVDISTTRDGQRGIRRLAPSELTVSPPFQICPVNPRGGWKRTILLAQQSDGGPWLVYCDAWAPRPRK